MGNTNKYIWSSLAFNDEIIDNQDIFLEILENLDIDQIEFAPTKIWPKWDFKKSSLEIFKKKLDQKKIKINGIVSIFYNTSLEKKTIGNKRKILSEHINKLVLLNIVLKPDYFILGSPKIRTQELENDLKDFILQLAKKIYPTNISI